MVANPNYQPQREPVYTQQARAGTLRFIDQNSPICQSGGTYEGSCFNAPAGVSNATVDSSGQPVAGVNIVSYNAASNDPAAVGLDPSVQQIINSSKIPLPNDFGIGDGLNMAAFDWLAAEHEKQLDYTIRIDHTFSPTQSVFVRWSAGHQKRLTAIPQTGTPIFPGFPNAVDTFRAPKNLAVAWRWAVKPTLLNEL